VSIFLLFFLGDLWSTASSP